jgi:hypothetical protein
VLDHETRSAILRLHAEGHGTRFIARALGASRAAVQKVIVSGQNDVPPMERDVPLDPHLARIRDLHDACRGNLVRVHEELGKSILVPYSTLTRFCRDHDIGRKPPKASGRYDFQPGEEMQHDTSPHRVVLGGRLTPLQCASLVMCFSRKRFIQDYPRFNRFYARIFLTEAFRFFDGAAGRCMVDNSTVLMTGTGANARAVPEMEAFSQRFGFAFVAHAVGDANRSARVEGPFNHVEKNFYPGRTFADLADLNAQLRAWCEAYNRTFHRSFQGIPDEMYAIERRATSPLPPYIPEPTDVHPRKVDAERFVRLHTNRYSVAPDWIDADVEVHETFRQIRIFRGHQLLAVHDRKEDGRREISILREHHLRRPLAHPVPPSPEEITLRAADPALAALCDALRVRHGGQALKSMRRLHRMWLEYPTEPFLDAIRRSVDHTLYELDRIERLILENIRGDFFRLPKDPDHGR